MTNIPGATLFVVGEPFHNARISTFEDTLPEGNLAVVHGYTVVTTPEGESYEVHYVINTGNTTASGFERREIFVNSGKVDLPLTLYTDGAEALAKAGEDPTVEMELIDQEAYGRDFTLGDILSVDCGIWGAYALQVTEVTTHFDGDGRHIDLTLGNEREDIMRVIRDSITKNPSYRW